MKNITITINTENAAFEDGDGNIELVRILRDLASKVESGSNPETLRDINGNKVGTVIYK